MVLWDTSPPSSPSADLPNKVAIHCPSKSPLDLLACRVVTGMSLDSVTLVFCILSISPFYLCVFVFVLAVLHGSGILVPRPELNLCPCTGSVESSPLNCPGSPSISPVLKILILGISTLFLTPPYIPHLSSILASWLKSVSFIRLN